MPSILIEHINSQIKDYKPFELFFTYDNGYKLEYIVRSPTGSLEENIMVSDEEVVDILTLLIFDKYTLYRLKITNYFTLDLLQDYDHNQHAKRAAKERDDLIKMIDFLEKNNGLKL